MTKVLQEINYKRYISAEIIPVLDSYNGAKQAIRSIKPYLNQ